MAISKAEQKILFVVRDSRFCEGWVSAGPVISGRLLGCNFVTERTADRYVREHGFKDQRNLGTQPRG